MATITIQVDDALLADFYEARQTYVDPAWTVEEKALFLQATVLEPYIYDCLFEAGQYARRKRVRDQVAAQVRIEEKALRGAIKERIRQRLEALPSKFQSIVEQEEPIQDATIQAERAS